MDLTPARRRELKARAHSLEPVVMIGDKGLSAAVLKEIDVNLKSHELIKIRVAGDDRTLRKGFLDELCTALGASAVQHIGKILVVYRENPERAAKAAAAAERGSAKPLRPAPQSRSSDAPRRRPSATGQRPAASGRAAKPARTPAGKSRSAGRTR